MRYKTPWLVFVCICVFTGCGGGSSSETDSRIVETVPPEEEGETQEEVDNEESSDDDQPTEENDMGENDDIRDEDTEIEENPIVEGSGTGRLIAPDGFEFDQGYTLSFRFSANKKYYIAVCYPRKDVGDSLVSDFRQCVLKTFVDKSYSADLKLSNSVETLFATVIDLDEPRSRQQMVWGKNDTLDSQVWEIDI